MLPTNNFNDLKIIKIGIKFSDLKDILAFIIDNYDASIDYINNFITTRLDASLEEDDEPPPRLDCSKITYLQKL